MIRYKSFACLAPAMLPLFSASVLAENPTGMAHCAGIADSLQRLTCYDQIARGQGLSVAAPGTGTVPPATAGRSSGPESPTAPSSVLDSAAAPAAIPVPVPPPVATPVPPDAYEPSAEKGTAAPAPPPPPVDAQQAFGLYSAEHPHTAEPQQLKEIKLLVTGLGTSADGHATVSLEGDQVWQLDGMDPLLAAGQTVTISRGMLRSFILTTRTGRFFKARRLH